MKLLRQCVLALGMVMLAVLAAGCADAPLDYPRQRSTSLDPATRTTLSRKLEPQPASHGQRSAFYLLDNGVDALVARLALIDAAEKSIDAQCFLLADDVTGNLTVEHMLSAARRGVRVRLLVDDWHQGGQDSRLAAIDDVQNVELRIFNPSGDPRWCAWTRPVKYAFGPDRTRKRMHNKALIVDNAVAVVGGRNLADEYFTASDDHNFGDLDLVVAGPLVPGISSVFDRYWNHRLSVPIEAMVDGGRRDRWARELLHSFRRTSKAAIYTTYMQRLQSWDLVSQMASGAPPVVWGEGEFLYDVPEKVTEPASDGPAADMTSRLNQIVQKSSFEALMISPYLVPGESGARWLSQLRERGVAVKILTNSLASTDETAAYGAFGRYRARLLRNGVELYEFRSRADLETNDGAAARALHAKCIVLDRKAVYIGSMNLDRRSARLDTQDGIVVWNEELAARLKALFDRNTASQSAYRLMLRGSLEGTDDGRLAWMGQEDGRPTVNYDNPDTGPLRRLRAWMASWLVPEEWL